MSAPASPRHSPLAPAPLTLHRTFGAGEVVRQGRQAPYRRVELAGGEAHVVRDDLLPGWQRPTGPHARGWRPLLSLAHLTDLQLADVQSPARFEFFNREFADPRFAHLVPVQRPQEALTPHAVDSMLRTLNRVETGPAAGAPLSIAVTTGDAIDNAQWNELQAFLTLLDGGLVRSRSGGLRYEGVQALHWPDEVFWRPDGAGPAGPDLFRTDFGFPHHPGLLERALRTFRSGGLSIPWLACFGNHEALIQGVGALTPDLAEVLVGGRKPVRLPDHVDRDSALETFIARAHAFVGDEAIEITPDPDRRPITRKDFVDAHFRAGAQPEGHGFTAANRRDGTAYYAHDTPAVRFIALDTTCVAGAADGALDVEQAGWLADRLAEVHSTFETADGTTVRTGNEDRLVVIFSHHGLDTLTNRRGVRPGLAGGDVVGAPHLLALLHRFANVVLWLNGHTHTNGVRPRRHPTRPGRGFWEVTTCAVVDWPCQTRLVELVETAEGDLAAVCTMVDHDSPLGPAGAGAPSSPPRPSGTDQLAGLHRELASNVPWAGTTSPLAGTPADRNVVLPLRAPFPLHRLPPP